MIPKKIFSTLQIKESRLRESKKLTKYIAQLGGLCLSLQLYPLGLCMVLWREQVLSRVANNVNSGSR